MWWPRGGEKEEEEGSTFRHPARMVELGGILVDCSFTHVRFLRSFRSLIFWFVDELFYQSDIQFVE